MDKFLERHKTIKAHLRRKDNLNNFISFKEMEFLGKILLTKITKSR